VALFAVKRRKGAAEVVKGEVEDVVDDVKHAVAAVGEALDHALDRALDHALDDEVERVGRQLPAEDSAEAASAS
jgi:hypothetical protein